MRISCSTRVKPIDENTPHVALREGEVKFDPDILRELLLYIEEHATEVWSDLDEIILEGRTEKEVTYHVELATDAGLLKATIDRLPDDTNPSVVHTAYSVHSIHFNGHEVLSAIRDPKHLRAIKEGAAKVGATTVGAFYKFALAFVLAKVNEYIETKPWG